MNYSYVAILAGYEPTPAEEMTGVAPDERPSHLEHYCSVHKMKFFKKGKMQGYAHPIEGTDQWCNEEKDTRGEFEKEGRDILEEAMDYAVKPETQAQDVTKSTRKPLADEGNGKLHKKSSIPVGYDRDWLTESLKTLEGKNGKVWNTDNVLSFIAKTYNIQGETVIDATDKMEEGMLKHFLLRIQEGLDK